MKLLLAIAPILPACATNTGNPSKDRAGRVGNELGKQVFNAVLQYGLSQGAQYLAGHNGQDAAQGAFVAAQQAASAIDFGKIVQAYAGPEVAQAAQGQFTAANPQTPAERSYIANVIGAGLQLAANQLAK